MKSKRRYNWVLILLAVAFVGVLGVERLTRPIPLTYVEAVKEVKVDNDNLKIVFSELVSDYELNHYSGPDVNVDIGELSDVVIIAWNSPLNKYVKTRNSKNEIFDVADIGKVLYSELDNEGINIVIYGANNYEGGSFTLPRLAMNYYLRLNIILAIISFVVKHIFKYKQKIKKVASIIYLFSLSYILSSIIVLGLGQSTYFMTRDLFYILVASICLFSLFYNLWNPQKTSTV